MNPQPSLLIVEDDTLHRIIYSKVAQRLGFRVQLVKDADEAIAAIRSRDYACVLLDLMLGNGSGEEVLGAAADLSVRPAVILISGAAEEVVSDTFAFWDRSGIRLLGPLRKPANLLEIRTLLEQVLSVWTEGARSEPVEKSATPQAREAADYEI